MVCAKRGHKVTFTIGAALLLGAVISTVVDHGSWRRALRTEPSVKRHLQGSYGDQFECRLSLFEFLYNEENFVSEKKDYMCSPMTNGVASELEYQIDLGMKLQKAYQDIVKEGFEPVVSVTGATIDETNAKIILSEESEIFVVDSLDRKRRRKLNSSQGTLSALALRVILNDAEPCYTNDEMYGLLYQDEVSLKNQYKACSFGKLIIEPSSLGVIDIRVDLGSSASHQSVVNAATTVALDYLYQNNYGSFTALRDYADLILYITPDLGGWLAYASVGGGMSVYNNKWGGFISSIMHETGHNFDLLHAYEGEEYLDYTGYMGGAIISYHDKQGFPAMCFNAPNHWQMGWFDDRSLETDLFTPTLVRVAAFVDYDKTTAGLDYVVVRTGNVYMHYNRAKSTNIDTYEYKDHLVLYQSVEEGSFLFGALSYPEKPVYERTFPQGLWRAEICEKVEGDSYSPDYLTVSIGFGDSLCNTATPLEELSTSSYANDAVVAYINDDVIAAEYLLTSNSIEKAIESDRDRGGN